MKSPNFFEAYLHIEIGFSPNRICDGEHKCFDSAVGPLAWTNEQ